MRVLFVAIALLASFRAAIVTFVFHEKFHQFQIQLYLLQIANECFGKRRKQKITYWFIPIASIMHYKTSTFQHMSLRQNAIYTKCTKKAKRKNGLAFFFCATTNEWAKRKYVKRFVQFHGSVLVVLQYFSVVEHMQHRDRYSAQN